MKLFEQAFAKREDIHEQVEMLLPWYLNKTLSPAERQLVEEHLAECAACGCKKTEVAQIQTLVNGAVAPLDAADEGLARLMQRIGETTVKPATTVVSRPARQNRIGEFFAAFGAVAAGPRWLAGIAAAVLILLAVPASLTTTAEQAVLSAAYQTLSSRNALENIDSRDIHVVFAPTLAQQQRLRLLDAIGGEVLAGPSERGVYRVRIAAAADLAGAVAALRKDPGVLLAEPAQPVGTVETNPGGHS